MKLSVWDVKSQFELYKGKDVFDCLLAEYILSEGKYPLTLSTTLQRYAVSTLDELASQQQTALQRHAELASLFYTIELPLASILSTMEQAGIAIDQIRLQQVGEDISNLTDTCVETIQKLLKAQINLSSPAQVGNMLVAQFKVPLPKTPSGQYATGEAILQQFRAEYPIIQHLLTYRELTKLQNTYVAGLLKKIEPDGKIHTTYNQSAVITGRLSSSNPNLQNIPVTSDLGKQIKSCFIASPEKTLVSFDYSQQELRILAHMSKDETLIKAFLEGKDIHTVTASEIFATPYDRVTKPQRTAAKTINFGIVYGMGSFGLSQQLGISVEEAARFIDTFYANFPGIKQFFETLLTNGQKQNYITTILGRRRYVLQEGKSYIDNNTRRELINFPIQGSAADFIKKAMVELDHHVLQNTPTVTMLLQIHDELVFEISDTDSALCEEIIRKIHHIMTHTYQLAVPMDVDVKKGARWGEMQPITL